MAVNLDKFDQSATIILKLLADNFPTPAQIGFNDLFPTEQDDMAKREMHIGVIAFLRHENLIAHETGSASSFIITCDGLALFEKDILNHLKVKLKNM
jgi:hypothetical protein